MPLVIVLDFDGTVYRGDLPVQAYARRVAEPLDPATGRWVIGGMRAFLEGRPAPPGMPVEFSTAEDGFELVRALAAAAGVPDAARRQAYLTSRDDLARSAFALDEEPGLRDFLSVASADATVRVVTAAPLTGLREVLDAVGLLPLIDEIHPGSPKPEGLREHARRAVDEVAGSPRRVLAVGDRWHADLAPVAEVGGRTAHVDRYRRQLGTPTWRGPDFAGLLPALTAWITDPEAGTDAD